ncbi:hypothetical protein GH714_039676 [Hevea brasiliensis]|uniref:Bromo domain-containing protein n=1 Tax=Hevea brasiliensis TaxID=3981 RepID=A0A6A6KEQ3_HEVBR|nr:hypothetical protein GH714_039676 [Hevea brasiliensis]
MASDDSSSHYRLQPVPHNSRSGTCNSLPGYVQFDDKVRISLYSGSKSVIRELKRKLVSELDQVRSWKKKLEAKEIQFNDNGMMDTNGVATLARVNSEVSYVGPTNPRPLQGLAVSVDDNCNHYDYGSVGENVNKEKKTPKVNQNHKNLDSVRRGKILNSENEKKLKLVKSRLKKNLYESPKEFAEDVRLTFNNAMTYNEKGQDVHIMADVMLKLFEEKWAALKGEFNFNDRFDMGYDASIPHPLQRELPLLPLLLLLHRKCPWRQGHWIGQSL